MAALNNASRVTKLTRAIEHRVCVLGGAVIGLSTALRLAQRLKEPAGRAIGNSVKVSITIVADQFPPLTTSNVAAGLFRPFSLSGDGPELVDRWTKCTRKWLDEQVYLPTSGERGIFPTFAVESSDLPDDPPEWVNRESAFHMLNSEEARAFNLPPGARSAWSWLSLVVQSGPYLIWLKEECLELDILFEHRKVESMDDLGDFDLVVNCTGLGSFKLFNDHNLVPVRGQVFRVDAPWIKHITIINSEGHYTYMIPNMEFVVVGGILQEGNWNTELDPKDSEDIWERCCTAAPSLRRAKVLEECVGLRPNRRGGVRIELEHVVLRNGGKLPVVHHYGHGGSGYTIHWGCAQDAVDLVMSCLQAPSQHSEL